MHPRVLIGPLFASVGCTCPDPSVLDGRAYAMFGNLVEYEETGFGTVRAPFPVNGPTTWSIEWGSAQIGPVTVLVDFQPFEGQGVWDDPSCGRFSMAFGGTYRSALGELHVFQAEGDFVHFDDVLEGELTWTDRWTFGEAFGTFEASEASVTGTLAAPR